MPSAHMPDTDVHDASRNNELARNWYNVAQTIDGLTFVKWHDSSE